MEERKRPDASPEARAESAGAATESAPESAPLRYDPQQDEAQYKTSFQNVPKKLSSVITTIGEYLGEGEHSVIFKGQLAGTKRAVVVKVDNRPLGDEANYNAIREKIDALKNLRHPGIAELIDFIPDWDYENPETGERGRSFIIMQYMEGKSLNQELVNNGLPRQRRVLNWAIQLLGVLRYLHKNQRVAGHISPANLVLGPRDRISMVDFNYISAVSDEIREKRSDETAKSAANLRFVKPLNPEELQAGILRDIFYLGATLFELLTGGKWNPDDAGANETLFERANVFPSVRDVIRKATAESPKARYQSALEMETALRELPRKDSRSVRHVRHAVGVCLFCAFLLALGGFYYVTGQKQLRRVSEMDRKAAEASDALRDGDYTAALRLALEAAQQETLDPPVTANAQAALAEILGVYDYVPGYKPLRSDYSLSGRPRKAAFAPDGDWIAVLTDAPESGKVIRIFRTESGQEKKPFLPARNGDNCAFLFLDYDTLLYEGEDGLTSCDLSSGKMTLWDGAAPSDAPTGLALSADGKVAARVVWDKGEASVYNAENGALLRVLTIPNARSSQDFPSAMEHMAALDASGKMLALSLPGGGAGLFPTDGSAPTILNETSQYRLFEGGFWEHFFFYAASNIWAPETRDAFAQTECRLIDLNTMQSALELNEPSFIHAQADRDGIYLSVGSELYRVNPDAQTWEFLADVGEQVSSLRHAAGRLLVVTANKLALVYREDGAWRVEISRGSNGAIADISKNYLLLANPNKALLSVLEWKEREAYLKYSEAEGDRSDYENYYSHLGAHVHADGESALLFSLRDFRLYDMITCEYERTDLDNPSLISGVSYHRYKVADDDPDEEFLKVTYDKTVEFYSAKTGKRLEAYSRPKRDADDVLTFRTERWRVEQRNGGAVEIYQGGKLRKRVERRDRLSYASETGDILILSLETNENKPYSVILDSHFDEIANLPEPCEATPEGAALLDDRQGNLYRLLPLSVEDLRALASRKLEAGKP